MSYVRIDNGNNLLLQVVLSDGNASMFPQAKIYSSAGTLLTTVNLTNVAGGLYTNTAYTPAASAEYFAVYTVYQDSGHTIAAAYNITSDVFDVRDPGPLSTSYTPSRAANLDDLDAAVSSRAPASTALSTAQWTNLRASNLDDLDAAVSSRASQTSVNAIPTNPLLSTDSRVNNLDAAVSSRAPASTALSTVQWTNTRAGYLDNLTDLDAAVSSRASQTSVNAIPTNPLLTTDPRLNNLDATISSRLPTSDSRLNNLDATVSSRASQSSVAQIQNNTLAAFIVPDLMVIPDTGSTPYNFYAYFYDETGVPIDPDSNVVNVTIKNSGGTILAGPTAMTRNGVGIYFYQTSIAAGATEQTQYTFFDYSVDSVALEQVRTSQVSIYQSDIDVLLGRLTDARAANLDNLDVTISSRATQTSVDQIPTNPLLTNDSRLENLDAAVSSRASQTTANSIKAQTDQMGFDSYGNIRANAEIVSDKAGYALTSGEHAQISDDVWDAPVSAHQDAGSFGAQISVLSPDGIAEEVWDTGRVAHDVPGTFGEALQGVVSPEIISNIDVPISSRASATDLDDSVTSILNEIDTRATQTSVDDIPTDPLLADDPRLDDYATHEDISGLAQAQYVNRMTTVFRNLSQDQEVLVWAERDGQRRIDSTDCEITVFDSQGNQVWTASSSTPSGDGIFRFINAFTTGADRNFYVVISIVVDGLARENQQPFFSVG